MSVFRATAVMVLFAAPLALTTTANSRASDTFTAGVQTGTVQNTNVTENSGIAASHLNPNVLWFQQDSGNGPHLYATTAAGANLADYTLSGASNTDWEDIAVGPGPTAGVSYVYLGDIGDNNSTRSQIAVYRVPEPVVSDTQSGLTATLTGVSKFTFVYPDGAHNAESLFVDPLTKDIYVITKHIDPSVYRAAYPDYTTGTTTLTRVASFTDAYPPTAADISPDGSEIIVRGYPTSSGYLFQRQAGGTVADAFGESPISIPLQDEDTQGEGIGFDPSGHGYYTDREGLSRPIYYFDRLPPPGVAAYWDGDAVVAGNRASSGSGLGGSGTWDATSLKWYNGSCNAEWQNSNDAVFGGAAGTVTLSAGRTVNSLSFKTSGYMVTGSTLTLGGPTVTVDPGVTATISSIIAGSTGLIKEGAGTLVLTNSSNQTSGYTGGTTINGGTLNVSSGAISHSGVSVAINNGSTLQFTGNFTLAAARSVVLGSGGGNIDVQGNSDTIAGVMSGTALTKNGTGILILTNANDYSGGTTVADGKLLVMNASGSGTGTGTVTVRAGATLGGAGTVQGDVTSSGTVAPGSSVGTLHVGGTYTQSADADLGIELASTTNYDVLAVTLSATLGGTLSASLLGGFMPPEGSAFQIVTAAGLGGSTFSSTSLPALAGNLAWSVNYGPSSVTLSVILPGDFNGDGTVDTADYVVFRNGLGATYSPADYGVWRTHFGESDPPGAGTMLNTAVPEPATIVMLTIGTLVICFTFPRMKLSTSASTTRARSPWWNEVALWVGPMMGLNKVVGLAAQYRSCAAAAAV